MKVSVGTQSAPVNQFGYLVPRDQQPFGRPPVPVDGQPLAVTAVQPAVAITRGEKTIQCNAREQAMAVLAATQPPPPRRKPIHWQQTRLEAPAALEASRSRTDLLSSAIARQQS